MASEFTVEKSDGGGTSVLIEGVFSKKPTTNDPRLGLDDKY